uniref:Uncharacterized protein n=1 Tax=Oryza sativa subsp. japonica TaxID=39947 RepID=Q6K7E7_ORYSJ|nr:hypothetical protein [Oryza sativa Japonica Group]
MRKRNHVGIKSRPTTMTWDHKSTTRKDCTDIDHDPSVMQGYFDLDQRHLE